MTYIVVAYFVQLSSNRRCLSTLSSSFSPPHSFLFSPLLLFLLLYFFFLTSSSFVAKKEGKYIKNILLGFALYFIDCCARRGRRKKSATNSKYIWGLRTVHEENCKGPRSIYTLCVLIRHKHFIICARAHYFLPYLFLSPSHTHSHQHGPASKKTKGRTFQH
jgi:hypothetical protein